MQHPSSLTCTKAAPKSSLMFSSSCLWFCVILWDQAKQSQTVRDWPFRKNPKFYGISGCLIVIYVFVSWYVVFKLRSSQVLLFSLIQLSKLMLVLFCHLSSAHIQDIQAGDTEDFRFAFALKIDGQSTAGRWKFLAANNKAQLVP